MGEDAYYIRKSIDHFLCDFPNKSTPPSYDFTPPHTLKFNQTTVFHSELSSAEFQTGDRFFCSPDFIIRSSQTEWTDCFFFSLTIRFCYICCLLIQPAGSLQIDHIFSLNRTAQFTDAHELYELYYLRNLFPVYMNKLDYHIHCFYTNEISHF